MPRMQLHPKTRGHVNAVLKRSLVLEHCNTDTEGESRFEQPRLLSDACCKKDAR